MMNSNNYFALLLGWEFQHDRYIAAYLMWLRLTSGMYKLFPSEQETDIYLKAGT